MHLFVVNTLLLATESNDQLTDNHFEPLWNECKWSSVLLTTFQSHFNKSFSGNKLCLFLMHLFVVNTLLLATESNDQLIDKSHYGMSVNGQVAISCVCL